LFVLLAFIKKFSQNCKKDLTSSRELHGWMSIKCQHYLVTVSIET